MRKMETYLIIALIGIVLFGIIVIVMRMNLITIPQEKSANNNTVESNTPFLGIDTVQVVTTGNNNIAIGYKITQ
jgi:hypothetical protein